MGVDSNNRLRDQIKSKISWPNVADDDKHTYLGVFTRTGDVGVSLNSYSGECLGNLDNCPNGLSLSFWMNYNGKRRGFFSVRLVDFLICLMNCLFKNCLTSFKATFQKTYLLPVKYQRRKLSQVCDENLSRFSSISECNRNSY